MESAAPAAAPATTAATDNTATKPATQAAAEKPKSLREQMNELLKSSGGYKMKAGGKEVAIDSFDAFERYAQRGQPLEATLEEVAKQRAELEPQKRLLAALTGDDESAADEALERLLGNRFDALAEKRILRQIQREESMKDYSPRERELRMQLDRERAERERIAGETKQREESARQQREQAEVRQHLDSMSATTTGILDKLGISGGLQPMAVQMMRPMLEAALRAGVPMTVEHMAPRVEAKMQELFVWMMKSSTDEQLAKHLGSDFDKRYRKMLLGKLDKSAQPAAAPTQSAPAERADGSPQFWQRKHW